MWAFCLFLLLILIQGSTLPTLLRCISQDSVPWLRLHETRGMKRSRLISWILNFCQILMVRLYMWAFSWFLLLIPNRTGSFAVKRLLRSFCLLPFTFVVPQMFTTLTMILPFFLVSYACPSFYDRLSETFTVTSSRNCDWPLERASRGQSRRLL